MNLNISEIFFSLNGEGILIGVPTIFVRLSGCNLHCAWCDTQYAWEEGPEVSLQETMDRIHRCDNGFCSWTLLTGGEPLLQDIGSLIDALHKKKYLVGIETNGSVYESCLKKCDFISADLKPPSSGNETEDMETFKKIIRVIQKKSGQVKAVIADSRDYQFVRDFTSTIDLKSPLVLQPCWGRLTYRELCHLYFADPLPLRHVLVLTQIHKLGDIK